MWRRLCTGSLALLLALLVYCTQCFVTPVFAHSHVLISTPTPDATAALQDASNTLSQAQDILNIVNGFVAILGLILAFLALLTAVFAVLGFRTYTEMRTLAAELRKSVKDTQLEASKTRNALIYLTLGDRLLAQRNIRAARENYHKVERLLPNDTQVNYILGRTYSGIGDYDAAIDAFEVSLKNVEPEDIAGQARAEKELGLAYRRRGDAFKQSADYDLAIRALKKSITLEPNDDDALAILGGLYRRKEEYLLAVNLYERAWHDNPRSSYALGNLASLSWYLGKVDDAKMYFGHTEVVAQGRLKSGETEMYWDYYDLALARLAQGKINDAKGLYQKAIHLTPGNVQIDAVLNNLYLLRKAPQSMAGLDAVITLLEDARKN